MVVDRTLFILQNIRIRIISAISCWRVGKKRKQGYENGIKDKEEEKKLLTWLWHSMKIY